MARPTPAPERKLTDESLAAERTNADAALAEKATAEAVAANVMALARERADAVLATAREVADAKANTGITHEQSEAAVASERALEDKLIGELRAKADETLRKERDSTARVLAELIPVEREKTDQYLRTERARSDDSVSNRDDFLGMVTHDLRNLLDRVVLSAHLIAVAATNDEHDRATFLEAQQIQRSAAQMTRLIGDLVDVASIEAGQLKIKSTVGDPRAAIRDAVESWTPLARMKGITLQATADKLVIADFDHERVLQILGNLISNAVKFSASGSAITIGVEEIDGEARFSVKDTGPGIPPNQREAIFVRYWQVGKTGSAWPRSGTLYFKVPC